MVKSIMQKIYSSLAILALSGFGTMAMAQAGTLSVKVNDISSNKGKILLSLYNQGTGFPGDIKKALLLRDLPATKGSIVVSFGDLPKGKYAIAVFHDKNSDNVLNTNVLGIPKEDYGFSNNARSTFRAPTFQEAAIYFDKTQAFEVNIK